MQTQNMRHEIHICIASDTDIVQARQKVRELAIDIGFSGSDLALIATAVSEIARNIVEYAVKGEIIISEIQKVEKRGILIKAKDEGPGIPDIQKAMQDGYSTGKGLGLGLPGAKRLMDEFDISSIVGKGTIITLKKWLP